MDAESNEGLDHALLAEACRRYGLNRAEVEPIGSFDNVIYDVAWGDDRAILRLSDSVRRSANEIRAEIAWIDHLAAGGVPCARALPSAGGQPVEVIERPAGGYLTAVLFERAAGRHTTDGDITADFVRAWGATLGRIHARSRGYQPPDPSWTRPDWLAESRVMEPLFPPSEVPALARFRDVMTRLEALPRAADTYGLIHADAHRGNFFIHRGRPVLFDFDGCTWSWFVNDLAITLFYAVMDAPDPARRDSWAAWFLKHLLAGYRREHALSPQWLPAMPDFLRLRELDTYALTLHYQGEDYHQDPWAARFMAGRKQRIEADTTYLDRRWETFA